MKAFEEYIAWAYPGVKLTDEQTEFAKQLWCAALYWVKRQETCDDYGVSSVEMRVIDEELEDGYTTDIQCC